MLIATMLRLMDRFKFSSIKYSKVEKILLQLNGTNLRSTRKFSNSKLTFGAVESIIDENNVFRGPFGDVSIGREYFHQMVWTGVEKWWNKTALVCALTGRSYTYGELRKLSGRFATALRRNNLQPGDTLAVVLPNFPEYVVVVMGASEAGVKVTLLNPLYTAQEIGKQLENSEAAAVITFEGKYPAIMEYVKNRNTSIHLPVIIVPVGSSVTPPGTINFRDMIADGVEEFEKTGETTETDFERDTMLLPYSSGTTGLPKGVELTHRNIVSNMYQVQHPQYHPGQPAVGKHQEVLPLFLPLFHIYGLIINLAVNLTLGAKLICMPLFTSDTLLEVLTKHPVTMFYTAPPVVQLMLNDERFTGKHLVNCEIMISGAAPLGRDVIRKFQSKFGPKLKIAQGYGLTETAPVVSSGIKSSADCVGFIVPNSEVRIVGREGDKMGRNLGIGEVGELCVRGPQVMKGYYKHPEATADCVEGEWFKTGDLGCIDDKGQVYITGRLKELIKVQGFQVSPVELESLIQGHEKVADAAVIGVPHGRFGEVPKAFVVPKADVSITEEEIKKFVAERVSKYKQIGEVAFIDNVPKSAAGKILRRELQKL